MTDLERMWDELPSGQPPVDDILHAGRREAQARRRRLVGRPLMAVGAFAALFATFVVGTHVGETNGPGGSTGIDARPAAFQADLDPAASCDELLTSYRDRGLAQVGAWGWAGGFGYAALDRQSPTLSRLTANMKVQGTQAQTASATGTNVQEPGVDEPDTVKTDGRRIVRVRGNELIVHDATGQEIRKVSTTHLPRIADAEIVLDGDTVVVIGADRVSERDQMSGQRRGSRVITLSLDDDAHPIITSDVAYSSRVLSVRQHGAVVRLVLAGGLPELGFTRPQGKKVTEADALAANRLAVSQSTIDDWLPTYDTGSGPQRLVDCTDVAIPSDKLGLDTVSVVGFDTAQATDPHAIAIAGATTIAYESADRLYLATSPLGGGWGCDVCDGVRTGGAGGTSHVFEFDLDGLNARHVASGEIEGTIADRWSIDEADGVLRVAVGPSAETGNFNSIVTMRRDGKELAEIGRIDGLGRNEQIQSVRWFDDLAIVVTFRQTDPLYTVDLSDTSAPKLLGALKIPGYSAYLHPLGDDELLGIGYDGRGRDAQIAVFDIADLANVRREAVVSYPRTQSLATYDPRAFTWLPDKDTVLTVVEKGRAVSIAAVTVRDGQLESTLTPVEYGSDAQFVRTLELSDGRIALITGEDVRFFDLP